MGIHDEWNHPRPEETSSSAVTAECHMVSQSDCTGPLAALCSAVPFLLPPLLLVALGRACGVFVHFWSSACSSIGTVLASCAGGHAASLL